MTPGDDGVELLYARSKLVVASAAAGIDAPTGPVFTDLRDLDGLRHSTEALIRLGFGSRPAIHPAQVQVINDVFTPTAQQLADARELIEAFEEALARGAGRGGLRRRDARRGGGAPGAARPRPRRPCPVTENRARAT